MARWCLTGGVQAHDWALTAPSKTVPGLSPLGSWELRTLKLWVQGVLSCQAFSQSAPQLPTALSLRERRTAGAWFPVSPSYASGAVSTLGSFPFFPCLLLRAPYWSRGHRSSLNPRQTRGTTTSPHPHICKDRCISISYFRFNLPPKQSSAQNCQKGEIR